MGRRARAAPSARSRRSASALTEAQDRARLARRRARGLRGAAPRADRRDRARRRPRAATPPTALAAAETALAEADRAARAALEAMGEARTEAARAEERLEARRPPPRRRRARNPRDARDRAGAGRGARRDRRRRARCPTSRTSRSGSTSCAATASGSAPSTCAPRKSCARSRRSTTSLVTERDDLVEAIKRLRQGIQSLNREARERLLASFEVVNGHFQRLFTSLFGGGTAELQLIESDDPLEAGLDILAKPPGKKPATLSLLSGGEQALTALALIFAVFLTNPAPICVLDEVDAPLDDHNVDRFCDLLDEMTQADRHALRHHHAQPDHHGADEPPVRRHHGGARRLAARVGRSGRRGEDPRSGLAPRIAGFGRSAASGS